MAYIKKIINDGVEYEIHAVSMDLESYNLIQLGYDPSEKEDYYGIDQNAARSIIERGVTEFLVQNTENNLEQYRVTFVCRKGNKYIYTCVTESIPSKESDEGEVRFYIWKFDESQLYNNRVYEYGLDDLIEEIAEDRFVEKVNGVAEYLTVDGNLTLGKTTLDENQLQQLLALIGGGQTIHINYDLDNVSSSNKSSSFTDGDGFHTELYPDEGTLTIGRCALWINGTNYINTYGTEGDNIVYINIPKGTLVGGDMTITATANLGNVYNVYQTYENVESTWEGKTIDEGLSFIATLSPVYPYQDITDVQVTMGKSDITSQAWDSKAKRVTIIGVTDDISVTARGSDPIQETKTIWKYLHNAGLSSGSAREEINYGESYFVTFDIAKGNVLQTIRVTMNDEYGMPQDITSEAVDTGKGEIYISSVTGNVNIWIWGGDEYTSQIDNNLDSWINNGVLSVDNPIPQSVSNGSSYSLVVTLLNTKDYNFDLFSVTCQMGYVNGDYISYDSKQNTWEINIPEVVSDISIGFEYK